MKITILNGSPRVNGNTVAMVESFKSGAESAGHNVKVISVGTAKINGCIGCEYCQTTGKGKCVFKDDMLTVYDEVKDAEMVVLASPVYYFGFTGQMQSAISRFYAIGKPKKAKKYAMLLSSYSPDVYEAILSQYNSIVDYFGAKSVGVITAYGRQNKSKKKLDEVYNFAKSL